MKKEVNSSISCIHNSAAFSMMGGGSSDLDQDYILLYILFRDKWHIRLKIVNIIIMEYDSIDICSVK